MNTVERVARAIWNENPTYIKEVSEPSTTGYGYSKRGVPVLWDDEDMLESDRELFRAKAKAALLALSTPEAISEGMVKAAWREVELRNHLDGRKFIAVALAAAAQESP